MPTDRDDELLQRHLLGELPDDETVRLEERLLLDDDLFELAEAVEADLLADAAAGELAAAERDALAPLAAGARGRRTLALARDLGAIAAGGGRVVPFPSQRARGRPPAARSLLRLAAAASFAAALATAAWLALDGRGVREVRQAYRGDGAEPARATAPARQESERREAELRRVHRRRRGPLGERVAELQPPPPASGERRAPGLRRDSAPPAAVEATLLLSLATLRSGGAVPRLLLAPEVERVRLEVDLGATAGEPAEYAAYAAVLRDAAGSEVWRGEGIAADRDGVLRLAVPAPALAPGRYELAVAGLTGDGAAEDLGFPELEIARP
jgi:hypothetical protein